MKRVFNFLLFVALLAIAVGALQLWKDRRYGTASAAWTNPFLRLMQPKGDQHRPETYTLANGPRIDLKDVNVLAEMSRQRIILARAVVPSVVSIVTSKTVEVPEYQNNPAYQFFQRNLRRDAGPRTANQLGSGAIVSKEGHIVTNNHVIEGMDEIAVKLSDGRERAARLVGIDKDTDIAVLKIDADDLTALPFGNSDAVEVGETVMAVGNPYGWEESVTQGIISAKGRRGSENVSDLFQIDAAINPGNSGGPLINVRGELIGINEAIFSRSGGWQGVGFAIPSATVRRVVDGILKTGRVIHGYLGIWRAPTTTGPGVLVDRVIAGSPADQAAIHQGDVIQKFNGRKINDFEDLRRGVAEVDVDSTVPVEINRAGQTISVNARIAEQVPEPAQLAQAPQLPPGHPAVPPGSVGRLAPAVPGPASGGLLGAVVVRELAGDDVRKLNLPADTRGVVVTGVDANSPASQKLRPGDVIETINQESVNDLDGYARLLRTLTDDQMAVLSVVRARSRTLVVVNPE